MPFTTSDICKIILAIFLPPLGVFLERGCGADLLINILLTILGTFPLLPPLSTLSENKNTILTVLSGYIPGILHALYIILKY